jgi:tetratricopeptide (TPR) repeat protein
MTVKRELAESVRGPVSLLSATLSVLALALSTVQAYRANVGLATLALTIVGTVLLTAYNVSVARADVAGVLDPKTKRHRFSRRFRFGVHAASAIVVVVTWLVALTAQSNKGLGLLLARLDRCEAALAPLQQVFDSQMPSYRGALALAECHAALGHDRERFRTLEDLLGKEGLLATLSPRARHEAEFNINMQLARYSVSGEPEEFGGIDRRKAYLYLERARVLEPRNPHVVGLLALHRALEVEKGSIARAGARARVDELFQLANTLLDSAPSSDADRSDDEVWLLYLHALSLAALDYFVEADGMFRQVLVRVGREDRKLAPSAQDIHFSLGRLALASGGGIDMAREHWAKVKDREKLGEAMVMAAMVHWDRGHTASEQGDDTGATTEFREAWRLISESKRLGHRSYEMDFTQGVLYFSGKEYPSAAGNFALASRVRPSSALAQYWVGRSHFMADRPAEARRAFQRARELDPKDAETYYWLGRLADGSGEQDSARALFEQAIELNSSNANAYMYLMKTVVFMSDTAQPERRIRDLERVLRTSRVGVELAESQRDTAAAAKIHFAQILVLNDLAYTYAERRSDLELALDYINEALRLQGAGSNSFLHNVLDTKAWILVCMAEQVPRAKVARRQELLREATELLRQALGQVEPSLRESRAELLYHLGYIERLRNKNGEAKRLFRAALDADPQHDSAKVEFGRLR